METYLLYNRSHFGMKILQTMLFELPGAKRLNHVAVECTEVYVRCGLTTQTSDLLISLFNKRTGARTIQLFDALFIFLSPLTPVQNICQHTHTNRKKQNKNCVTLVPAHLIRDSIIHRHWWALCDFSQWEMPLFGKVFREERCRRMNTLQTVMSVYITAWRREEGWVGVTGPTVSIGVVRRPHAKNSRKMTTTAW